jgi:predicted membrane protein
LPYCRRCGNKLDEDAHFCYKCGTPVASPYTYSQPTPSKPSGPLRKDPVIIAAIVLVSILLVGVFVAVLLCVPFATINIGQTYQDDTVNIDTLNLNFQSSAAQVNIFTQKINNSNFMIAIDGFASKGMFSGETGNPVSLTTYKDSKNGVLTATAILEESTAFSRLNVNCKIYVDPDLKLNLNITSKAGQVSLTADKDSTFQYLNLQSSAGHVQANLQNATVAGNLTFKTQAGAVDFRMNQAKVNGNNTITLQANAGSITMDITETKTLQGNLQVNALTDLGSINLGLTVDNGVAANITSQTSLGSIHVTQQNFSGNQSPIQSNNYPAQSNIEINNKTNLGSININANYQSATGPSARN